MKALPKIRSASNEWMKIGDVAKLSGVGIETLRFYEKQGLLTHATRTQSGYRLYNRDVLERLEFIKRAQVLGFSLAEIAHLIKEKASGISPCADAREIVRNRLAELDDRMREMRRYRKELAAALAEWDKQGAAEGSICGLIESTTLSHALAKTRVAKRSKR
jgi:MerR family transcriptional regulator, copper efflux regulator